MSRTDSARGYHHGNLRDALILAAAALIEEQGDADFAMVDAARRAGVSSAAPYRHFKDKAALLDGVLELLFLGLAGAVREACERTPAGSTERIVTLGKAYIDYLTARPAFYQLMWGERGQQQLADPSLDPKTTGFYLLLTSVEEWCEANQLHPKSTLELATRLWAMAHGLMALSMHRHLEKFLPDADITALLQGATQSMLDGLRHDSYCDPE